MNKKLFEQIEDALDDRNDWEQRQETWYQLRMQRLGRKSLPYPGAPDKRYGLPGTMIDKVKPLYIAQLYANEQLARFVSTQQQDEGMTTAASEWFDYQLKQKTNFEPELFAAIDGMLQNGFAVIKVYWDAEHGRLCFSTVDPLHIIIPGSTEHMQCSDWLVHVLHMSEAQYKKNPLFAKEDDLIKKIKGKGDDVGGSEYKDQVKKWREGINCAKDNEIVLWEVYHKESEQGDAGWMVDTISPVAGWECEVRGTFGLPYNHGQLPFFRIQTEITDKSWYAPRGITEIVASDESSLNRLLNGLFQHLDFHGTPTYKQAAGATIGNTANYRSSPGGILPAGIEPTIAPGAPIDFANQIQFQRALAEDRVSVPDLGASEHLTGNRGSKDGATATQINAIVGQSSQGNDMRARVFRMDMAVGFKMAWSLLNQYKRDEVEYLMGGQVKQVPPEAIHEKYLIEPNCSPDSWNKSQRISERLAMYQMLMPNPFIKKGELTKWLLEVKDPSDIKRLYQEPEDQAKDQQEAQAAEIVLMLNGFAAQVDEADDDKTHLITMAQFVERRIGQGEPITPELARLLLMHGGAHNEGLTAKKDPMLRQITQQMLPLIQVLSQIAQQPDQPNNVVQMQPQGSSVAPPQVGGGPASAPQPQEQEPAVDTAVKVGNMLVNMVKAGIPVTHAEINKVMAEAGLAPLALNPIGMSQLTGTDGQPTFNDTTMEGMDSAPMGRPSTGMIMPPVPPSEVPPPVNVINIASEKTITVRREKDGTLTGTIKEVMPKR